MRTRSDRSLRTPSSSASTELGLLNDANSPGHAWPASRSRSSTRTPSVAPASSLMAVIVEWSRTSGGITTNHTGTREPASRTSASLDWTTLPSVPWEESSLKGLSLASPGSGVEST